MFSYSASEGGEVAAKCIKNNNNEDDDNACDLSVHKNVLRPQQQYDVWHTSLMVSSITPLLSRTNRQIAKQG